MYSTRSGFTSQRLSSILNYKVSLNVPKRSQLGFTVVPTPEMNGISENPIAPLTNVLAFRDEEWGSDLDIWVDNKSLYRIAES